MSINHKLKSPLIADSSCHANIFSTQVNLPPNLLEEPSIFQKAASHRQTTYKRKKSKQKLGWRYWLLKAGISKVLKALYKYLFDGFMVNNHLR